MAISTNDSPHTIKVNAPMPSTMCCSSPTEKSSIRWRIRIEGTTRSTSAAADNVIRADSGSSAATKKQSAAWLRLGRAHIDSSQVPRIAPVRDAVSSCSAEEHAGDGQKEEPVLEGQVRGVTGDGGARFHGHQHNDQHL